MSRADAGASFVLRWRAPERLITVDDYRRAARYRLPAMVWAYIDGGAEAEVTLSANRSAFAGWELHGRVLRGVERPDLTTVVAGDQLDLPVLLAPTGLSGLTYWRGDLVAQASATRAGTRYVLSTASSWTIEEVAAAGGPPPYFQLYPRGGAITENLLRRAHDVGCRVLMVTVDAPVVGNRERERKRGMGKPPVLTPARALNFGCHPAWTYRLLRHQRMSARNLVSSGGLRAAVASAELATTALMQPTLSWDDVAWMRDRWNGPAYLKGILHPSDAETAVGLGFDGVVVSNHGGRQLDRTAATLDALPAVVDAIGSRGEVLLDGGIRRGSDIVTALALGARAVLIGRPCLYGLAVGGERGVDAVLEVLRSELAKTLTLMGVASVAELGAEHVRRVATYPPSGPPV